MLRNFFLTYLVLVYTNIYSQVGINIITPHHSSVLGINANNIKGGLLIPRIKLLSTTDITTILNTATGLIVINLNASYFTFALGGSATCSSGDLIKEQEVIWEYLAQLN